MGAAITINVAYSNGTGIPIYQWYQNTTASAVGATAATGTGFNTNTYTPQTLVAGTLYYYCTIELPDGGCNLITSQFAEIVVNPDPTVNTQPLANDTICEAGTIANPLTVSYTAGTGVGSVSYQWYDGVHPNGTAGIGTGANTTNYTPVTNNLSTGTYSYYAIISFDGNDCNDAVSDSAQIVIIGDPIANFNLWSGLNTDTLCENHNQNSVWINQSSGVNISSYTWEIIDINSITVFDSTTLLVNAPTFGFLPAGNQLNGYAEYDLILSVENACSTPTDTHRLVIEPLPDPSFDILSGNLPTSTICIGSSITVSYGNTPAPSPFTANNIYNDSVRISWGDGSADWYSGPSDCGNLLPSSNLVCFINANHQYVQVGSYNVCVTAYNRCDSITICDSVEVINSNILSSVQVDTPNVCVNECIIFSDNSSFNAPNQTQIHWWWDIDPNNLTDYLQPNGIFSPDSTYNQSSSGTGYQICHEYSNPGIYFALFQMATGPIPPCNYDYSNIVLDSIIIYPEPTAYFINPTGDNACLGDNVTFEYDSEIIPVIGITGQIITNVYWEIQSPGGIITVVSGSPGVDLDFLVDSIGIWTITLIVESNKGCSNSYTSSILVHEPPFANYSIIPDSSCVGNGLTYFDASSSVNGSGIINQYLWDFSINANPISANGLNVSTEFLVNGNWFIDLIVIDNYGCRDTVSNTVVINNSMTSYFNGSTECLGTATNFFSSYPLSSPNANNWYWDFGDGLGYSNIQDPSYTYNAAGDYLVTLVVSDTNYSDSTVCMDIWSDTIHVNALPIVNFTSDTVCWQTGTTFLDASNTGEPGSNLLFTRDWYFDNDSIIDATSINPVNIFDSCGLNVYNIRLGVEDNLGCYNIISKSISISCPPTAQFTVDTACIGTDSYFEDNSSNGSFSIINYQWYNYGSGSYFPTPNVNIDYSTFVFNSFGVQDSTRLIVSDPFGCSDTTVDFAYVRNMPNVSFYTLDTNYCQNAPIQFFENSFTNGIIQTQSWTFATGTPSSSTLPNPVVTFPSYGNWNIQLNVTDENGCSNDTILSIEIDNLPTIDFEWNNTTGSVCADTLVCFNSLSSQSTNGNPLFSYIWDFGDGFGSDSSLCYDFNSVDPYYGACVEVILTVTDSLGCSNNKSDIITIHPIPEVDDFFATPAICQGEYIVLQEFIAFNTDPCIDDEIDYLIWYFNGDSISSYDSTTYEPPLNLSTDSNHYVTLQVFTDWGCVNEYTNTIEYNKVPELFGPLVTYPTGQCGDTILFNFTSSPADYDSISVALVDPIHSGAFSNSPYINTTSFTDISPHSGIFDVEIYLENGKCSIDSLIKIKIYPVPTATFTPLDSIFCYDDSKEIYFTDSSTIANKALFEIHTTNTTEIVKWQWNLDSERSNNISINQNTAEIFEALYDSATAYVIQLIVETNFGCQDTAFGKITVLPTPIANFVTPIEDSKNYGTYLMDATTTTTTTGADASTDFFDYNWIISDGPFDIVNILNTIGDNNQVYYPVSDSLYYQFNYFLYGNNDSTETCLIVGNKIDISSGITNTCEDTVCKSIRIEAWAKLFIPNALYPEASDDGSRLFLPKGKSLTEYNLQIFDKFGNLLWENNEINVVDGSPKVGWDGTSEGLLLPQGTYIWRISARFINGPWNGIGDTNLKTGTVYLIR